MGGLRRLRRSINPVKLCFENFIRSSVSKGPPRQAVAPDLNIRDLLCGIAVDPFSLGNESPYDTVPGLHQPKIHVVVQCFGAGDLFPSELAALERPPLADIQRPAIFTHMPINVGDESVFSQAIIVTAAVSAVLLVGLLALLRLVSLHMPIVQVDRAAPQLIAHRIRSAADLSSDTVWGAALFVAYLDDHSFIIRKMLALYMLFCGRMYLIHSDPPLEIVL